MPLRLQINMRPTLWIAIALFATACERPSTPLTMGSPDAVVRPGAAPARVQAPAPTTTPPPVATVAPMPPTQVPTDASITGKIRSAVLDDPGMAGADVSVNTDHGVVALAGTVKSFEQAGIASALAQRQDGVVRVDNQLRPALS